MIRTNQKILNLTTGEMMKKLILAALLLAISMTTLAQDMMDDGSRIVLPLKTQECGLPSAPPPIPEVPIKDDLLKAQKYIKTFQSEMIISEGLVPMLLVVIDQAEINIHKAAGQTNSQKIGGSGLIFINLKTKFTQ